MKNSDEINDNINELILQKSFDQLTDSEKIKALEHAGSEANYNSLRSTLMAITSSFSEEVEDFSSDKSMKNDLMNRFKEKHGHAVSDTKVVPLYRKPLFQLAVAASLTLVIVFSFPLFTNMDKSEQLAQLEGKKMSEEEMATDSSVSTFKLDDVQPSAVTTEEELTTDKANGPGNSDELLNSTTTLLNPEGNLTDRKVELKDKEMALDDIVTEKSANTKNAGDEIAVIQNKKSEEAARRDQDEDQKVVAGNMTTTTYSTDNYSGSLSKNNRNEALKSDKKKSKDDNLAAAAEQTSPMSPMKVAPMNSVNAFVEQNKGEILDLMFTVY